MILRKIRQKVHQRNITKKRNTPFEFPSPILCWAYRWAFPSNYSQTKPKNSNRTISWDSFSLLNPATVSCNQISLWLCKLSSGLLPWIWRGKFRAKLNGFCRLCSDSAFDAGSDTFYNFFFKEKILRYIICFRKIIEKMANRSKDFNHRTVTNKSYISNWLNFKPLNTNSRESPTISIENSPHRHTHFSNWNHKTNFIFCNHQ